MKLTSLERGTAPICCATTSPFLKSNKAGILRILYFTAVSSQEVTSTLTIFTLPAYSLDKSSRTGAIALQGAHQPAQKSTSTGVSASRTSAWKLSSVVFHSYLVQCKGLMLLFKA